jgi:AcrR family transcriptional regulator
MDIAKRECILEAAVRAFSRLGFKKTAIDDIARAAGVAKGTVYLACDSKEDLFYQAVHRELRAWISEVSQMIDPRVPADQLLQEVSARGLTVLEKRPLVRDLFVGLYHGQLPGWNDRFDELKALGRANIVELLRLGQKQKIYRPELDIEAVAYVLHELSLTAVMDQVRDHRPGKAMGPEWLRRGQAAMDLVMNGLRVR